MIRKELFAEVESLLNQYCDGCFLFQSLKEDHGRRHAHRFCITQCTVGEKLKQCGSKLS